MRPAILRAADGLCRNGSGNEFSGNVWDNTDQALKA